MRKNGKHINCEQCGQIFYAAQWQIKANAKFCSRKCKHDSQKGKKPWNYGLFKPDGYKRTNGYGYIEIKDSKSKNKTKGNFVLEHRQIMSNKLNRPLSSEEMVHHINYIKNDNRIKNLFLCSSLKQHLKIATSLNNLVNELLNKNYIIFDKNDGVYKIL